MKKSQIMRLLLVTVLSAALTACGNNSTANDSNASATDNASPNTENQEMFFTFANVTESGPLFVELGKGMKAAAEKAGVELKVYNNNFDGATALKNAQLMVQDKPDLIIEYNGVEGVGNALQAVFEKSGIPSIGVNVPVPGSHWFNLSNKQLGIDAGKELAQAALEKGWKAEETTIIIAQSATAGTEVNDSVRYFYVSAAETLGLEGVAPESIVPTTTTIGESLIQVDGKSTLEDTYTSVKNVLQTVDQNRKLLVFSVNDDSTLGAWRAIEESGRTENTLVAGLGGSEEALKQLRENPQWVAEGSIFMSDWGQYLIAMGVAIVNGTEPPALTPAPQVMLTKENVNDYYPNGAVAEKLPPLVEDNMYLKDTGILQLFGNIQGLE
ncbi:sugar ABC transporter substrate-binding protein [Paenibacillus sp. 7124]|uniref:Sugar ABC transporter substrate-binding protein n=1 Tax=Paenibacillus apii TaxID=1850370 RepID=A0A6M1PNT1_9BACL|nr:substrate-binding domain-containing protein [Paenibacillus apii]NGM85259.1 sugar ABC transporter substrate-binding protein [Paenibacillus apii]